jgi:hypothetical protein
MLIPIIHGELLAQFPVPVPESEPWRPPTRRLSARVDWAVSRDSRPDLYSDGLPPKAPGSLHRAQRTEKLLSPYAGPFDLRPIPDLPIRQLEMGSVCPNGHTFLASRYDNGYTQDLSRQFTAINEFCRT